jgi:putative phosphoserine phosphatase/1-acylglycerol-3-phosphate O-acyltransferase
MARGAAFFDLDRTLLAGASWPTFAAALRQTGVLPDKDIPLANGLFAFFRAFGESYITMRATRRAASRTLGWNVEAVDEAARLAAPSLLADLQPYARSVIDEHRSAGRPIVLATTTPERLVLPFSETLGFDGVVATRYGIADGCFDGTVDGPFVWNRGKLDAVTAWAAGAKVPLRSSYAYSDSFFDAPLLNAVGHPTAVNPDVRLATLAGLQGWPVRWLDKPAGVPKIAGLELQELLRPFVNEALIPNVRFEFNGLENLPAAGGAVVCGNHRSYFDPTAIALTLAKRNRNARFLGKKEVFDAPVVGALAKAMGGIRVDRGTGSDQPLMEAVTALQAGDIVGVMPQGTIPRGPAFFEPELKGRWGAARLAALARVPVIPIGLWGTERVWPRASRLPRLDLADPPLVTVTVGPPVKLTYEDADLDTKAIMAAIVDLLPPEARVRRTPTAEELQLTYPPGYQGDPTAENERRPGSD